MRWKMKWFVYEAKNIFGNVIAGQLKALSKKKARRDLINAGYIDITVKEGKT